MKRTHKIPLLKNHHTHPSVFAALRNGLDLSLYKAKPDAVSALGGISQDFSLALGWDNSRYVFGWEELDRLPPLMICNVSFHEFLINRPAREKFAAEFPEVMGNIDDTDWVERNLHRILEFIAGASAVAARDMAGFYNSLAQEGVWYAEDKLLPGAQFIDLYKNAGCFGRTRLWMDMDSFEALPGECRQDVGGIKIFLDGAVGAGTAALFDPYPSGGSGLLLLTGEQLQAMLKKAADYNKAVSIHTIGNRSTHLLINTLRALEGAGRPPEIRVEHCQFISPDMAEQAKNLGVILSMQPNFSEDSVQYRGRLPKGYAQMNNPFRMLIDHAGFVPGLDLFFGSDGPPHGAAHSIKSGLFPPLASQTLSLEELVAGYCMNDFEHGYVDITIDDEKKNVEADTVLNPVRV